MIIAGDLYDGDLKDYSAGLFFARQMARLQDAGIQVFVISGNHDAVNNMTRTLKSHGNVTMPDQQLPGALALLQSPDTEVSVVHVRSSATETGFSFALKAGGKGVSRGDQK